MKYVFIHIHICLGYLRHFPFAFYHKNFLNYQPLIADKAARKTELLILLNHCETEKY